MWDASICSTAARSAIVRDTFRMRSCARAERPSRLVAACDKRHNLGDLVWDLHHEGPPTFARFNAGPAEQLWYFESVTHLCREAIPARLALELERLMTDLRSFCPAASTTTAV